MHTNSLKMIKLFCSKTNSFLFNFKFLCAYFYFKFSWLYKDVTCEITFKLNIFHLYWYFKKHWDFKFYWKRFGLFCNQLCGKNIKEVKHKNIIIFICTLMAAICFTQNIVGKNLTYYLNAVVNKNFKILYIFNIL